MSDFKTEWGVKSPWGCSASNSREDAAKVVHNMRMAGHDSSVIWRGITDWHYEINDERAMEPVTEVSAS